jgi:TPR repeat protein
MQRRTQELTGHSHRLGGWRGAPAICFPVCAVLLAGCASQQLPCASYPSAVSELATVDPVQNTKIPDANSIAALACHANQGDKHAQLALGKRYEQGLGVAVDLKQAARYYARAAQTTQQNIYVYSPPVGNETYGRTIGLPAGPSIPGLAEAQLLLGQMYLDGRGVRQDIKRGRKLIAASRHD